MFICCGCDLCVCVCVVDVGHHMLNMVFPVCQAASPRCSAWWCAQASTSRRWSSAGQSSGRSCGKWWPGWWWHWRKHPSSSQRHEGSSPWVVWHALGGLRLGASPVLKRCPILQPRCAQGSAPPAMARSPPPAPNLHPTSGGPSTPMSVAIVQCTFEAKAITECAVIHSIHYQLV